MCTEVRSEEAVRRDESQLKCSDAMDALTVPRRYETMREPSGVREWQW
jgi:hypothetical protein